MTYDESYYKAGNYTDYLDRRERYHRLARDIDAFMDSICLRSTGSNLLDYGCGPGFLMEGFRELGYTNVVGHDISKWAIQYADNIGIKGIAHCLDNVIQDRYHLTVMLDVLEHIKYDDINKLLRKLKTHFVLVRIPICKKDGGNYNYPVSNKDPTHITKLSKTSWDATFKNTGYRHVCRINLPNIWDSNGVLCALYEKNHEDV